jgi:hypothetical protein
VIFLGAEQLTCDFAPLFHVRDMSSELPEFGMCRYACEDVMTGAVLGCPAICLFPQAIALQPGEATSTTWNGLFRVEETLPAQCLTDGQMAPMSCDRAEQIAPGSFTFTAQAGTSIDCSQTNGACGECTPSGYGGCIVQAALIGGSLLSAETSIELDASYGVGDVSGTGATLPVQITFNE